MLNLSNVESLLHLYKRYYLVLYVLYFLGYRSRKYIYL